MSKVWPKSMFSENFDENVEVASRFDGMFNLWQKVISMDAEGGFSMYWQVIGVFDEESKALRVKEKMRERLSKKK